MVRLSSPPRLFSRTWSTCASRPETIRPQSRQALESRAMTASRVRRHAADAYPLAAAVGLAEPAGLNCLGRFGTMPLLHGLSVPAILKPPLDDRGDYPLRHHVKQKHGQRGSVLLLHAGLQAACNLRAKVRYVPRPIGHDHRNDFVAGFPTFAAAGDGVFEFLHLQFSGHGQLTMASPSPDMTLPVPLHLQPATHEAVGGGGLGAVGAIIEYAPTAETYGRRSGLVGPHPNVASANVAKTVNLISAPCLRRMESGGEASPRHSIAPSSCNCRLCLRAPSTRRAGSRCPYP